MNYTRGYGLLESSLARLRARKANQLIPEHLRGGRILDIGCGSYPYFLSHTWFSEKFAIDQHQPSQVVPGIYWHTLDLNTTPRIPFEEGYFNVVTMLAVIEHLDPGNLVIVFKESHRLLAKDGVLILTTPAAWSDKLLQGMARLRLVSIEEIREHKFTYTPPLLGWFLGAAGYSITEVKFGHFEFWLNLWAFARRT